MTTRLTPGLSGTRYITGVIISSKMPRRLRAPALYSMARSATCSNTAGSMRNSTPSPARHFPGGYRSILRFDHDPHQHFAVEIVQPGNDRRAAGELRDQPEFIEVGRLTRALMRSNLLVVGFRVEMRSKL